MTCNGGTANDCLSCKPLTSTYLNLPPKGACTSSCPAGYYPKTSNLECTLCFQSSSSPFTCATCDGPANSDCLSCSGISFQFPTPKGQCVNPCPDGYYGDYATKTCLPCYTSLTSPYTCAKCVGPFNYSCITCSTGQYLFPTSPTGQCVGTCPPGYYGDNTNYHCLRCYQSSAGNPYSCLACTGPSSTACISCISGTFLFGSQCIDSCPAGTWPDSATNTCRTCYQNIVGPQFSCVTCNGGDPTDCLSCGSGAFLSLPPAGHCVASCPNGYWADSGTNKCQGCYQNSVNPALSCLTCSGGTSNNCLSCGPEAYLSSGKCIALCSSTQWNDPMTGACQNCFQSTTGPSYSCLSCRGGSSSNCSSCSSGSYLYPAVIGDCLGTCPAGYYGDSTSNTCELCAKDYSNMLKSCRICSAKTLNDCLSCYSGAYLHPAAGGPCLPSCPTGFWADNSTNICQQCYQSAVDPFTCAACNGPYFNHCLACNAPGFLDPLTDSCVSVCPTGYWGDTSTRVCLTCYSTEDPYAVHGTCRSCYGPNDNQCTSCFSGRFYLNTSDTCVLNCPDGWFPNMTNNSCDPCFATSSFQSTSRTCATCVGPNYYECLSCLPDSWLYQNQCLSVCPDGTYPNNDTLTCDPCYQSTSITDTSQSCKTCSGPLDTNCLTCYAGSYLYPPQMSCLTSCPKTSWYPRTDTNECDKCYTAPNLKPLTPQSCLTCSGSASTNCNSCSPNTFLWPGNNSCVVQCPYNSSYYGDIHNWTCVSCSILSVQKNYIESCAENSPFGQIGAALFLTGNVASLTTTIISSGLNPGAVFLSNYLSVVTIYIYLNVDFPTNFVHFILSLQVNSFIPNPFAFMRDPNNLTSATNRKFAYWHTASTFLENCGFNVTKNLAILLIIANLSFLTALCNTHSRAYDKLKYLRDAVRWNVFLSSYLGDFPLMLIFTLLHLIENNNPGSYADFSLFLGIISLISYTGLLILFIFQLNRQKAQSYSSVRPSIYLKRGTRVDLRKKSIRNQDIEWLEVTKAVSMISEGYKSDNWVSRNFLVISMIQDLQTILLISLIQFSGLVQAIIYSLISLVYFAMFLKYKPMKAKSVSALIIINQLVKALMGVLAVSLGFEAVLPSGIPSNSKEIIGTILIVAITVTAGANVLFGIWFVITELVRRCRQGERSVTVSQKNQLAERVNVLPITDIDHSRENASIVTIPNPVPTDLLQVQTDDIRITKPESRYPKKPNEYDLSRVSLEEIEESMEEYKGYQRDPGEGFKFNKKPSPQFDYPKIVSSKKN